MTETHAPDAGVQVFAVEVDVAVDRPPTRENTRTVFLQVAVPLDMPNWLADVEARVIACEVAGGTRGVDGIPGHGARVVMPTAARIVGLLL